MRSLSAYPAVLYIQRVYRAWVVRLELQERRYAAEDIQALFRGFAQRKRYSIAKKRVVVLQRYARGWLARRWFRPALREYRRQLGAVARVQALWRGKMIRHEARIRCDTSQLRRTTAHLVRNDHALSC